MEDRPHYFTEEHGEVSKMFLEEGKLNAYKDHLKKIRTFLWVALILISALVFWWSENGRYKNDLKGYVIDSKTGKTYTYEGELLQ